MKMTSEDMCIPGDLVFITTDNPHRSVIVGVVEKMIFDRNEDVHIKLKGDEIFLSDRYPNYMIHSNFDDAINDLRSK